MWCRSCYNDSYGGLRIRFPQDIHFRPIKFKGLVDRDRIPPAHHGVIHLVQGLVGSLRREAITFVKVEPSEPLPDVLRVPIRQLRIEEESPASAGALDGL